jgi:hypothetical protein
MGKNRIGDDNPQLAGKGPYDNDLARKGLIPVEIFPRFSNG